jgi:SAM-dependent methyltransferase
MGVQATRRILETLGTPETPLVASWHVTEPSSESLEDSRSQLADWANLLEFDQLDIEQSPAKQRFTPGSYDIIVAFQALRATKNVTSAVANVRSLLKPGGTFLFAETTKDQVDVDSSVACCRAGGNTKSPIGQHSQRPHGMACFGTLGLVVWILRSVTRRATSSTPTVPSCPRCRSPKTRTPA